MSVKGVGRPPADHTLASRNDSPRSDILIYTNAWAQAALALHYAKRSGQAPANAADEAH